MDIGTDIYILIAFIFVTISNITCLVIGLKFGTQLAHRGEITVPKINNPIETINNLKSEYQANKDKTKFDIELENINNYDGSGIGQKKL
jgi:hypothetical protein